MDIELSVIMPSLNVADYIEECINSALNQTLEQMEIICIDAGSEDGTWEILKKYENLSDTGKKVRLIHSDIKSYGYQVNLGIKLAAGKYIAVLETDDMAEEHMYEYLLALADAHDLDFIKADYDCFYTLRNGERYYETISLWQGEPYRYNHVLDPGNNDYLYSCDYSIWAGIFNRDFLMRNNIWLNETKGAAYQDIGFAQQVLACAKRAYYCSRSFYRYRRDRELSSINSMYGLKYSRQEFTRLLSDSEVHGKLICMQGLYRHMASSFMGEYQKILAFTNYDTDSVYVRDDYEWFRTTLEKAVERSEFDLNKLPDGFKGALLYALRNCKKYAEELREQEEKRKKAEDNLMRRIGCNDVAVFGAGKLGKAAVRSLLKSGIKPVSIYDNNEEIWGDRICDVIISRPEKPAGNVLIFIANKRNRREIMQQLMAMGTLQKQIAYWEE